jgi:hypothetical protein
MRTPVQEAGERKDRKGMETVSARRKERWKEFVLNVRVSQIEAFFGGGRVIHAKFVSA